MTRELDERMAGGRWRQSVEQLARWWSSASKEERFAVCKSSAQENRPPLEALRIAIILAETEAGEVTEG